MQRKYYWTCLIYSYLSFNSIHSFTPIWPVFTLVKSESCLQEDLRRECTSEYPEGSICHKAVVEFGTKTQSEDNKQKHSHIS